MIDGVGLQDWDRRFREETREEAPAPIPFVLEMAGALERGKALDLACGSGRHALWLAQHGWRVTAVDGSPAAIAILKNGIGNLPIEVLIADLERHEYSIMPESWDLIVISLYLQRDLFEPAKLGVKPGGVLIAITLLEQAGKPARHRLAEGELKNYFTGWEILSYVEESGFAKVAARRAAPPASLDHQAGSSATEPRTTSG
jgi:SAM-dependent methyltransferase